MDGASTNDVAELCQSAREHMREGHYDAAIDDLRQATCIASEDAESHGLLGLALTHRGEVGAGEQALGRAVALDPLNADRRFNHAISLEKCGQLEAAIGELSEGLAIAPDHAALREALRRLQLSQAGGTATTPTAAGPHQPAGSPPPALGRPDDLPEAAAPREPDPGYWSREHVLKILMWPSSSMSAQRGHTGVWPPISFLMVNALLLATCMSVGVFLWMSAGYLVHANAPAGVVAFRSVLVVLWVTLLVSPILLAIYLVMAAVAHPLARWLGASGGLGGSFRAVVYSQLPAMLGVSLGMLALFAIPAAWFLGAFLAVAGAIWSFWILVVGLARIHRIATWRALAAALAATAVLWALAGRYAVVRYREMVPDSSMEAAPEAAAPGDGDTTTVYGATR